MKRIDLTGRRYGRLQVLWPAGYYAKGEISWTCQCDCGNVSVVYGLHLRNGNTQSCGCLGQILQTEGLRNWRHGYDKPHKVSPEYRAYQKAKGVCTNPNHERYEYYGARGIEFHFDSFEQFIAVVGDRPKWATRLNRIDREGDYEPGNVEWSDRIKNWVTER